MSIGSQQEIGAARRVSQKQLLICSQEDSAAEEEARAQRRNNRGATYISATHGGGQKKKKRLSHAKQQQGDEWDEYKAQLAGQFDYNYWTCCFVGFLKERERERAGAIIEKLVFEWKAAFRTKKNAHGELTHWVIHFHTAMHTDGARHCVFYQLVQRLRKRWENKQKMYLRLLKKTFTFETGDTLRNWVVGTTATHIYISATACNLNWINK